MNMTRWMKLIAVKKSGLLLFAFLALGSAQTLKAAPATTDSTFQLMLQPESHLSLNGDSTLHPYASSATKINFQSSFQLPKEAASKTLLEKLGQADLISFKVSIPVEGLKSGEKGLDKNMYKSLKSETCAAIEFRVTDKHLLSGVPSAGTNKLTAGGMLLIAGKENPVQIEAEYEAVPKGIHIFGKKKLLMSEYGIKPPTILGFIKVRDEVTINFDLVLSPN